MAQEIINWEAALQQVEDDEEFLRELLVDLKAEAETQVEKIKNAFLAPSMSDGERCEITRRASHVIKGAASNLMCTQLREASAQLEALAKAQLEGLSQAGMADPTMQPTMQSLAESLGQAMQNYVAFLESIGVK